jgi:hypothetical protein
MTVAAMHFLALAVNSILGALLRIEKQGNETVGIGIGPKNHAAAMAAIAAVGTTLGDILLPAKAEAPVASTPTGHLDRHSIDEFSILHDRACFRLAVTIPKTKKAAPKGRGPL